MKSSELPRTPEMKSILWGGMAMDVLQLAVLQCLRMGLYYKFFLCFFSNF
jgi:hypothetical protein